MCVYIYIYIYIYIYVYIKTLCTFCIASAVRGSNGLKATGIAGFSFLYMCSVSSPVRYNQYQMSKSRIYICVCVYIYMKAY